MISMKVKKDDKDALDGCCIDDNPYGYGLRLCLDDDRMKLFGFDKPLDTGMVVRIEAVATVVSASENASIKDGKKVGMDLQITDMGLQPENIESTMFKK